MLNYVEWIIIWHKQNIIFLTYMVFEEKYIMITWSSWAMLESLRNTNIKYLFVKQITHTYLLCHWGKVTINRLIFRTDILYNALIRWNKKQNVSASSSSHSDIMYKVVIMDFWIITTHSDFTSPRHWFCLLLCKKSQGNQT